MIIAALVLCIFIIFFIAQALIEPADNQSTLSLTAQTEADNQDRALQILDDLELDHAVGRLSDEEFHSARAELSSTHKSPQQDY